MMKGFLCILLAVLAILPVAGYPLVSNEGVSRDFPVIRLATPGGLIVRTTAAGRDMTIPWDRLDLGKCEAAHPWLGGVRAKAQNGETITLNLGMGGSPEDLQEWRTRRVTIAGGAGKNFQSLQLTAYIHREVPRPRLALVWVGDSSPLARRPDAADLVRRSAGALVLATFSGDKYHEANLGSGEALSEGLKELLADPETLKDPKKTVIPPAVIIMGEGRGGSFAWSHLCHYGKWVIAAVTVDAAHEASANAESFLTPVLFLQTQGPAPDAASTEENVTRPFDLWRHYSTEGCRWSYAYAAAHPDPHSLAVGFAAGVAGLSPYQEVLQTLEDWENNELKNRIPMPGRSVKDLKENAGLLATRGATHTFPVGEKKGDERHNLIWLPDPKMARLLAADAP